MVVNIYNMVKVILDINTFGLTSAVTVPGTGFIQVPLLFFGHRFIILQVHTAIKM